MRLMRLMLLVSAVALAACSGNDGDTTDDAPATVAPTVTADAAPTSEVEESTTIAGLDENNRAPSLAGSPPCSGEVEELRRRERSEAADRQAVEVDDRTWQRTGLGETDHCL